MSSEAGQSLVEKGIAEARSGNRLLARLYLERAVDSPPVAPVLWLWLAWVAESPEKARGYLQRLEGTAGLADVARGALPWIHLMCEEGSLAGGIADCGLRIADSTATAGEEAGSSNPKSEIRNPKSEIGNPQSAGGHRSEHRVECPGCLAVLYVRGSALGRTRICPACREPIDVPPDAPAVAASPPLAEFDYVPGTAFAAPARHGREEREGPDLGRDGRLSRPRRENPAAGDGDLPILVVDDNPSVRHVAATVLRRRGYEVEAVPNGIEALAWIAKRLPGLVLLDSQMPGMDGFEVCQRLRSHPRTRDLPIIMLSSQDAFFERVQGRLAGCSVYLTKPCDANVLCATVDEHYAGATRLSGR